MDSTSFTTGMIVGQSMSNSDRNCFYQDGVKFCESVDLTASEFGLSMVVITLWVAGLVFGATWLNNKFYDGRPMGLWITLYFVLTGLIFYWFGS